MESLGFALAVTSILLLMVGLGTGLAYAAGVFNPMGYMGVAPWNLPRCEHGEKVGDFGKCQH